MNNFEYYLLFTLLTYFNFCKCDEWQLILYTSTRLFSGSTSDIYVQLFGTLETAPMIYLKSYKRFERGSINKYKLNIDKELGKLTQLLIGIQNPAPFITDWNLFKAEVIDPSNTTYTFYCDCWLKYLQPQRIIKLTDVYTNDNNNINLNYMNNVRSKFPLTVGLLTMLTIILIFAYMANIICKKFRTRIDLLNSFHTRNSSRNTDALQLNDHSTMSSAHSNMQQFGYPLYDNKNSIDKPPDYKDLFPASRPNVIPTAPQTTDQQPVSQQDQQQTQQQQEQQSINQIKP